VGLGGVVAGEASDVDLVDDGLFDGDVGVLVALPVEVGAVGDAARGAAEVGDLAASEVAVGVLGVGVVVAERVAGGPVEVAGDGRGVGVEQDLVRVEAGAVLVGAIGAVGTIVVQGAVGQPLDEQVPDVP